MAALANMGYAVPGATSDGIDPAAAAAAAAASTGFSTGFSPAPPMMGVATGGGGQSLCSIWTAGACSVLTAHRNAIVRADALLRARSLLLRGG